jgi:cell wall-associated NlpC family hydrolase
MRGIRLAHGVTAVIAMAASAAVLASQQQHSSHQHGSYRQPAYRLDAYASAARPASGRRAGTYVQDLEGVPYRYGGTSTSGFDCSGLTQYVYRQLGRDIPRTAQEQFQEFRPIARSDAQPGDLVFFHDSSDPNSPVYHVGVYEGGTSMVAASSGAGRVIGESITWAGDTVTFGTITH